MIEDPGKTFSEKMFLLSKLQSLLGMKINAPAKTNEGLTRCLLDDVHNFHRHDFSSLYEFENDQMMPSEFLARMDRLNQICADIPSECVLAMRCRWGDDVLETSSRYSFEACLAALAQCFATFIVAGKETIVAREYERDCFVGIWGGVCLALLSFKKIATYCEYLREYEKLPVIPFQSEEKKKCEIIYDCSGFSSGAKIASGYVEKELSLRESMRFDVVRMDETPDYALGMTLARLYDVFEDVHDKECIDGKILFSSKEYSFVTHHMMRAVYAQKKLCSFFGVRW